MEAKMAAVPESTGIPPQSAYHLHSVNYIQRFAAANDLLNSSQIAVPDWGQNVRPCFQLPQLAYEIGGEPRCSEP